MSIWKKSKKAKSEDRPTPKLDALMAEEPKWPVPEPDPLNAKLHARLDEIEAYCDRRIERGDLDFDGWIYDSITFVQQARTAIIQLEDLHGWDLEK